MPSNSQLQLQAASYGIKPDFEAPGWHVCYFSENDINARDEEYYFPCSDDKQCCGRECCSPVAEGFPVWLAWLIGLLLFLLLVLLTICLIYYCWRYCKKKPPPTPPSPRSTPVIIHEPPEMQTYRHYSGGNTLRRTASNLYEIRNGGANSPSTNTVTTVISVPSTSGYHRSTSKEDVREIAIGSRFGRRNQSPSQRRREWIYDDGHDDLDYPARPFVPSPMRESYETSPTPIHVSYHDETEITRERRPLIGRVQSPDEQKARSIYYKPGSDRVASYNELPKPSENL